MRWAVVALSLALAVQAKAADYRAPRTASGAPDLQGVWTNLSLTRLERPPELKTLIVPDAEAAAVERGVVYKVAHPTDDDVGGHDAEWWDGAALARIDGHARTSWIVDPADGKLPYTADGKAQAAYVRAYVGRYDGADSRNLSERCLLPSWHAAGPPMLNSPYAANYQFVQTVDRLAILAESNSEVRIVRLGGSHAPDAVRSWMGDSVGHWEGETLVVETTNFRPGESARMSSLFVSTAGKVVERFTRVSAGEIRYQFSVEDPAIYTQVWKGEMPFLAFKGPMYESACHEGNYSLPGILAGARAAESGRAKAAAP